jgi:hypothetical protein
MRIFKSYPLLNLLYSYLIYTPALNNNNLLVLKSECSLLSMLPDVLDTINTINQKVLPTINTGTSIISDISSSINLIKQEVLPTVSVPSVDYTKMIFLGENYHHILKMESIALNSLSVKTTNIEF